MRIRVIRALAAAGAVLLSGGLAQADGMRRGSIKDTYEPSVFRWTGFYAGAHLGWLNSDNRVTDLTGLQAIGTTSRGYDDDTITGGLQIGYNWQFSQVVVGVEADLSFARAERVFSLDTAAFDDSTGTSFGTYGTLRGRLGYAFDRLLVYGTAGWAWARIHNRSIDTDAGGFDPLDSVSGRNARSGWVWGGGLEYALTDNWIGRIEALHMDFGDQTLVTPRGAPFRFKNEADTVRAGLSFKF